MLQKKICMLGSFAVGKTSLVRRYVDSVFSEKYVTTIGVKIDKKFINVDGTDISMLLWDVYGEDNHQSVLPAYLRGMAGYFLVIDATRPNTIGRAVKLKTLVEETVGKKPFVLVLNKSDLKDEWVSDLSELDPLKSSATAVVETSAKQDVGVTEMFEILAKELLPSKV